VKLVMTLLVRDEEDILATNFECHLAQGVDFFIVTDNLSVDGSREIIERYVRRGLAVCIDEPHDDYSQWRWVTRMARLAATDYEADWVINSDADEFWIGSTPEGIKHDLAAAEGPCLSVARSNFLPVAEEKAGFFAERMLLRTRQSRNALGELLPTKVCHRGYTDIEVHQGNHAVARGGVRLQSAPAALRILHYPARSYRQFENKIIKGGAAYTRNIELPPEAGDAWRYLHACWQRGGLPSLYRQMMRSSEEIEHGLLNDDLIYDDTLLAVLRQLEGRPAFARATA
jgi:hypothetical protein